MPCILYSFDILPAASNITLLSALPLVLRMPKDSINLNTSIPIKQEGEYVSIPVYATYNLTEDKSTYQR